MTTTVVSGKRVPVTIISSQWERVILRSGLKCKKLHVCRNDETGRYIQRWGSQLREDTSNG